MPCATLAIVTTNPHRNEIADYLGATLPRAGRAPVELSTLTTTRILVAVEARRYVGKWWLPGDPTQAVGGVVLAVLA